MVWEKVAVRYEWDRLGLGQVRIGVDQTLGQVMIMSGLGQVWVRL